MLKGPTRSSIKISFTKKNFLMLKSDQFSNYDDISQLFIHREK